VFGIVFFSFEMNSSWRKAATISEAFSGATGQGAAFSRSSQTLDREHRWNNAVVEAQVSEKKMKERRLQQEH